jgi:nicotinate-nucleotide adenylyltransferase
VIGGSFDPIHLGHLIIAEEARVELGLDRVVFVPAGQPPHKLDQRLTPPEHRLNMVRLAIADHDRFFVSRVDLDRDGPCYSVDTVRLLQEAWGAEAEISFLVGADSLADLPTWYRPRDLLYLCHIVATPRPGYQVDLEGLERRLPGASARIRVIDAPLLDISSTEIRERVRSGRPIRYLVHPAVKGYIDQHGLYRATAGPSARPNEG